MPQEPLASLVQGLVGTRVCQAQLVYLLVFTVDLLGGHCCQRGGYLWHLCPHAHCSKPQDQGSGLQDVLCTLCTVTWGQALSLLPVAS